MPVKSDAKDNPTTTTTNVDITKDKTKKGSRYSLKKLLDRSRFSPRMLRGLSKPGACKQTAGMADTKPIEDNNNLDLAVTNSNSPILHSNSTGAANTVSYVDSGQKVPISSTSILCENEQASLDSEFVEEEYEDSLAHFSDLILDNVKQLHPPLATLSSSSTKSSNMHLAPKSPDNLSSRSDAIITSIKTTTVQLDTQSTDFVSAKQTNIGQTPPLPNNFDGSTQSTIPSLSSTAVINDVAPLMMMMNSQTPTTPSTSSSSSSATVATTTTGIYNEPCDAKSEIDDPSTIYTLNSAIAQESAIAKLQQDLAESNNKMGISKSPTFSSNCADLIARSSSSNQHHQHSHQQHHQSPQQSNGSADIDGDRLSKSGSAVNVTMVQQLGSSSPPSVQTNFANSPRGNTVITHHPASPFARVPRHQSVGKQQTTTNSSANSAITSIDQSKHFPSTTASMMAGVQHHHQQQQEQQRPVTIVSDLQAVELLFPKSVMVSNNESDSKPNESTPSTSCSSSSLSNSSSLSTSPPTHAVSKTAAPSPPSSSSSSSSSCSSSAAPPPVAVKCPTTNHYESAVPTTHNRARIPTADSYPTYEEAWDVKMARQHGIGISSSKPVNLLNNSINSNTQTGNVIVSKSVPTRSNGLLGERETSGIVDHKAEDSELPKMMYNRKHPHRQYSHQSPPRLYPHQQQQIQYHGSAVHSTHQQQQQQDDPTDQSKNCQSIDKLSRQIHPDREDGIEYDYAYNGSWSMGVKLNMNMAMNRNGSPSYSVSHPTSVGTKSIRPSTANSITATIADLYPTDQCKPNHQHSHTNSGTNHHRHVNNSHHSLICATQTTIPTTTTTTTSTGSHKHQSQSESPQDNQNGASKMMQQTARPLNSCTTDFDDTASTDSYDESWDIRHGRLISELARGRFVDPATGLPTTNSNGAIALCSTNSPACASPSSNSPLSQFNPPGVLTDIHKGLSSQLENLPLEDQPWFHVGLTRCEAEELIRDQPEGTFLVRPSETCPNDFSLTIKHKTFLHMKISRNSTGHFILGEYSQPFNTVTQMIYHYARSLVPVRGAESVTLTHPVYRQS